MRLVLAFIVFAAIVLLSFFIWGDALMAIFSLDGTLQWLQPYGSLAWIVAVFLLIGDLLLPLPATIIMSAVGYKYGFLYGTLISLTGSFLSGSTGYWICRSFGERTTRWILGEKDFIRGKAIASKAGTWIVVLSRWLPVFPEVIACMAGLTRMNPVRFHLALLSGTIPLVATYAYIGSYGVDNPGIALLLSATLPPVIWLAINLLLRKQLRTD